MENGTLDLSGPLRQVTSDITGLEKGSKLVTIQCRSRVPVGGTNSVPLSEGSDLSHNTVQSIIGPINDFNNTNNRSRITNKQRNSVSRKRHPYPEPLRPESSLSEENLDQLVRCIAGPQLQGCSVTLDMDVKNSILDLVDNFVSSVTQFGCRLAKHRNSDKIEERDIRLHLKEDLGIVLPVDIGHTTVHKKRKRTRNTK